MDIIRHQRKQIAPVEFKLDSETEGAFRAVFSTYSVIDLDRDVTLPGAFETGAKTRIAAWGHDWRQPIIGVGSLGQDDIKAWVDGQFNMAMQAGRETYESVKMAGDQQEWSYGFDVLEWSFGQFNEQDVRFLRKLKVHEVSPVLLGAGIDTRTETIKAAGTTLPYAEHSDLVAALLGQLTDELAALKARTADRSDTRSKEGRVLSAANRTMLQKHLETMHTIADEIKALLVATEPEPKMADPAEVLGLLVEFERLMAQVHGAAVA